jgi:Family of unknown function (DUF6152)
MGGFAKQSKNRFSSPEKAMNNRLACVLCISLFTLIACGRVSAHHGSSNYDLSKPTSVKGTITKFEFINPHSAIHLEAKDDKGNAEEWRVEADSPNNLGRAGWTRDSVKAGDQVTIVGNRLKDGSKVLRLQKIIFADGKELKPREGDEY